jgi:hypothetical protein
MGTAFNPAKTSPASWDAFSDVDAFVDAAWGGLKPAPESRLRRACPSSSIQLRKPFGLAFVTHGLPGSDTILDGSNWTPVERRSLA